jgi:hypothetical protein
VGPVPKQLSRRTILLLVAFVTMAVIAFFPLSGFWTNTEGTSPRRLEVGDRFAYKVLYPDSKSYQLTETVQSIIKLNGSDTYLILRDGDQHEPSSELSSSVQHTYSGHFSK